MMVRKGIAASQFKLVRAIAKELQRKLFFGKSPLAVS